MAPSSPTKETARGAWSTEEQLEYVTRLLFHYAPTPSIKAVALPAGRTDYATQHFLRRLKKQFTETLENDKDGVATGPGAKKAAPKRKRAAAPKKGKKGIESDNDEDENDEVESVKKVKTVEKKEVDSENEVDEEAV